MASESRAHRELVLVALAAAIGLSLSILYLRRTDGLTPDSFSYLRGGISLVTGRGYLSLDGTPETTFPPGYPLLLGTAARATRDPVGAGRQVSVAASVASIPLIYLLGRLLFSRAAGLWATYLLALSPLRLQLSVMVLSESAFLALALGGLVMWVVSAFRPWTSALAGLLLGAAYLTRPEGLIIFAGCAFLTLLAPGELPRARSTAGLRLVALALGFAALALPYLWYLRQETGNWRVTGKVERNLAIASGRAAAVPYHRLRQLNAGATDLVYPETATTLGEHTRRVLLNLREEFRILGDVGGLFLFACLGLGLATLLPTARLTLPLRLLPLLLSGALLLTISIFFVEYRMMLLPIALLIVVAAAASGPRVFPQRGAPSHQTVAAWLLALSCAQFGVGAAMIVAKPVGTAMADITPLVAAVRAERDAPGPIIGNSREPRALALATQRDCLDLPWEPLPRVLRYADAHHASFLLLRSTDHPDLARLARAPTTTPRLRPRARLKVDEGDGPCLLQLYRVTPSPAADAKRER